MEAPRIDRTSWRLFPGESPVWHGRRADVPREGRWTIGPAALVALAAVFALFGALLSTVGLPGAGETAWLAVTLVVLGAAIALAPRFLHDPCEYLVTDRRVLWRRGRLLRSMDLAGLTFARIRWHRSVPGVGHLDCVRAVPFGPFARPQRITLLDVRDPDRVLALVRGAEPGDNAGDTDVSFAERLDADERVIWGGHPEGLSLGVREIGTAVLGLAMVGVALLYAHAVFGILLNLEDRGLPVQSTTWALLFSAAAITFVLLASVGVGLVWYGIFRALSLARETEYVLTDKRLLIRRGPTELSLDRRRIVDVADAPASGGLHHLFLLLDAPESRALAVSGALGNVLPARDSVPPILYELRDVEELKRLILQRERDSKPHPPVRDAA